MTDFEILQRLGVALAIGLLIGTERGWSQRSADEGARIAGIRSFGLIGLFGALSSLVSSESGTILLTALAFLGFSGLIAVGYWLKTSGSRDIGITSEIAMLITFTLGALAMQGHLSITAGTAVITSVLLGLKPRLHSWLKNLAPEELYAAFKLLLISVVLLPVLPDRSFGPWQAINPYEIWWMVVLIATISFIGYFVMKTAGPTRGVILTAISGGLASSTAVTFKFARLARHEQAMQSILSAGVIMASSTMFPRILLVASMIEPVLGPRLAWPLISMTIAGYGFAVWQLKQNATRELEIHETPLHNPFEIKMALQFGALLTTIMILAKGFLEWMGPKGVYFLAGISGVADVNAITLSMSRMATRELDPIMAATAIVIAVIVNTILKAVIAMSIGQGKMRTYTGLGFAVIVISGLIGLALDQALSGSIST